MTPLIIIGAIAGGLLLVSLVLRITDALSNFVIHLRVTGTVKQPVIRVEPIRLLSEDSVRFFLGQAVRTP